MFGRGNTQTSCAPSNIITWRRRDVSLFVDTLETQREGFRVCAQINLAAIYSDTELSNNSGQCLNSLRTANGCLRRRGQMKQTKLADDMRPPTFEPIKLMRLKHFIPNNPIYISGYAGGNRYNLWWMGINCVHGNVLLSMRPHSAAQVATSQLTPYFCRFLGSENCPGTTYSRPTSERFSSFHYLRSSQFPSNSTKKQIDQ